MNEQDAKKEALRLNRLYANQYKCYRRAIKNLPKTLEVQKQKDQILAKQIAQKDRKNAYIDELTDMCWYTYDHVTIRKAYIDKLVKDALKETNASDNCSLNKGELNRLTQDELHEKLSYDPTTGIFELNDGRCEGKRVGTVFKAKPPRKQTEYTLPIKPRTYSPSHAGYSVISEQEYLRVMSGADDKKMGLKYTGYGYTANMVREREVYKRHYLLRTRKERGKPASTYATEKVTYYIKRDKPCMRVSLKLGKNTAEAYTVKYTVQQLAYLYMGAGGDWDYSDGIDNVKKNAEHALIAPYGLRNYNPKTNRPMQIPCRDGDPLNCKWDNIKPDIFSTASILKDPDQAARDREAARTLKRPKKRLYSLTRNIKEVVVGEHGRKEWHVVNIGSSMYYAWAYEEAVAEFDKRLALLKGDKRKFRNGVVQVTS